MTRARRGGSAPYSATSKGASGLVSEAAAWTRRRSPRLHARAPLRPGATAPGRRPLRRRARFVPRRERRARTCRHHGRVPARAGGPICGCSRRARTTLREAFRRPRARRRRSDRSSASLSRPEGPPDARSLRALLLAQCVLLAAKRNENRRPPYGLPGTRFAVHGVGIVRDLCAGRPALPDRQGRPGWRESSRSGGSMARAPRPPGHRRSAAISTACCRSGCCWTRMAS